MRFRHHVGTRPTFTCSMSGYPSSYSLDFPGLLVFEGPDCPGMRLSTRGLTLAANKPLDGTKMTQVGKAFVVSLR